MKIFLCPDSFKGTMSSKEICQSLTEMIRDEFNNIDVVSAPVSDGGEGTVDTFLYALGGKKIELKVKGPLGNKINSFYGILKDKKTAVIEMAAASGLPLVGERKNPLLTGTYGTGQLIYDAVVNKGCTDIIIGIGGSATNDGGIGMAVALGAKITDENGKELNPVGESLGKLKKIDLSGFNPLLKSVNVTVACDVDNPLYGKNGAAFVFAPQKGANKQDVTILDRGLRNYADVIKNDLNVDVANIPGAGAAGGLGAGLVAFLNAKLVRGVDIVLDTLNFNEHIKKSNLIITGEGRIDSQSLAGKVPVGVAQRAKKHNIPVVVIAGDIEGDMSPLYQAGITAVFSTNRKALSYENIKKYSKKYLLDTARDIIKLFTSKQL